MTTIPFSASLAEELAQRERFMRETSGRRIGTCQEFLRAAMPPTVLKEVYVLYPYKTIEGVTHYRKVIEWRDVHI